MRTLYLMVGNIGSGKTKVAKEIQKREDIMYFSDDEMYSMINREYSGKYFTKAHQKLYQKLIINIVDTITKNGFSLIVDSGLYCISSSSRKKLIQKSNGVNVVVYNIKDLNGLERRLKENRNDPVTDWTEVYNMLKNAYEEPAKDEGIDEIISFNMDDCCFCSTQGFKFCNNCKKPFFTNFIRGNNGN